MIVTNTITITSNSNTIRSYDKANLKVGDKIKIIKILRQYAISRSKIKKTVYAPQRPIKVLSDDEFYSTITNIT